MNLHTCEQTNGILDSRDIGNRHRTTSVLFTELATTGVAGHKGKDVVESLALIEGTLRLTDEEERHTTLFEHHLLAAQTLTQPSQRYHTHQLLALMGHSTKTVYETSAIGCHLLVGLQTVELAIEQHALRVAGHILIGEIHLEVALQGAVSDK